MVTLLLYGLMALIAVGVLFVLTALFLPKGVQIAPPAPDMRPWAALPDRRMAPEEVTAIRLPVALRGYRFAEADLLLDRLTEELRARDAEIAQLRAHDAEVAQLRGRDAEVVQLRPADTPTHGG
ncbi:MAG: hypothetical protein ABJB98_07870 [Actinomycetota bacterium]